MNVEIRIFANPAGFEEMRLKSPARYSLFPSEVAAMRNFDGERGQLPNGTFSVYYTPDAYIIAYHFMLSSDAQFRDPEAHIAVAIRRGFKMNEPTATFIELANEFAKLAVEFKSSAADKIYNNTEKFYSIVTAKIVEDPLQFKFNTSYSVVKRAILAVRSSIERDTVLSDPFRKDLKDINILFIINYEDGTKVGQLISSGYRAIPSLGFQDSRTFILTYPDGHRVEFTDLNQELPDYTIHRKYEKPLTFSGSVHANWDKWKISVSDDKTEYKIGLLPEKEKKTFKVIALDQNGHELRSAQIVAKIGKFSNGQWTLEGEEIVQIVKTNIKDIFSITGYNINSPLKEIDETTICINASKIYPYDLSELFKFLNDVLGPNASVVIRRRSSNQKWQINKNNERFNLEIPYSDIYVQVPETTTTEEANLEIDSYGKVSLHSLRKKKLGEITISFGSKLPNDLKQKLSKNELIGGIVCKYNIPGYNKLFKKELEIRSYPIVLTDLPLSQVQVEVEVEGYNVLQEKNEVNLKRNPNQEIKCELKPTTTTRVKRYCKKHFPTFVVGVIIGILLGLWIAHTWSDYLPSNQGALSGQIDQLRQDSIYQQEKIAELKSTIEDLSEQLQEALKNNQGTESGTSTIHSGRADTPSLTDTQKNLINKLQGEGFTWDDVKTARTSLKGIGQDALINDAIACLTILNLTPTEKEQLDNPESYTYKTTVKKLGAHKSIMTKIITNEDYKSSSRKDFKSIKDLRDRLKL